MLRGFILVFAILTLLFPWQASAQKAPNPSSDPINITIINADAKHWFWSYILEATQKAATDLGIKLEIIDTVRDHMLYRKMAIAVFARSTPPDYLVIGNEKESAALIIKNSVGARTKLFLFNNGFVTAENKAKFANPRGEYPQWIGQLIPDNYQAGYDMGEKLFQALIRAYPNPKQELQVLGLTGSFNTHASIDRERGFVAVAENYPRIKIMQRVSAEWNGTLAETKINYLLHRYPKTVGIWAANDEMAEGGMRGAQKHKRVPGKDIFFVGCGWSKGGMEAIAQKRMVASAGGHFLDGAWIMARLYDYHHNMDELLDLKPSKMVMMDENNVAELSSVMEKKKWMTFDFKKWSKVYNPRLKSFDESSRMLLGLKSDTP